MNCVLNPRQLLIVLLIASFTHHHAALVVLSMLALSGCMGVGVMGQPPPGEYEGELTQSDAGDGGVFEEDTGPVCTYPTGPYGFNVDQTIEPMSWSGAASVGGDGTGADFEEFYCDPEVSSIFIFVGNTM